MSMCIVDTANSVRLLCFLRSLSKMASGQSGFLAFLSAAFSNSSDEEDNSDRLSI